MLQENFEGSTLIVPDVEGVLYLKDDGRKTWRPRYFMLRASGLYYVPKGKTKVWHVERRTRSAACCLWTPVNCVCGGNGLLHT